MLIQLNPPLPVSTPKGDGLAHVIIDYGIEHDLCWIIFLDESAEIWTFKNQDIRAMKNITFGRSLHEALQENSQAKEQASNILKKVFRGYKPCECEEHQASEPVSQHTSEPAYQYNDYSWAGKIRPDPMIPWNMWGEYLPDCKFYFITRKAGGIFLGNVVKDFSSQATTIALDAKYRIEDHGMIVGWKPYV